MHRYLIAISCCLWAALLTAPQSTAAASEDSPDLWETYTFEREIRLAPGEFYAVTYDNDRKEFTETEPDRGYAGLSDRAFRQVLRAPIWLREKFIDRLVDLLYDDIDVGEGAAPALWDMNGDGIRDLVVGNADGELKCFIGPYFKKADEPSDHVSLSMRFTGQVTPFVCADEHGESALCVADETGTVWRYAADGFVQTGYPSGDNAALAIAYGQGFYVTGTDDGAITATSTGKIDPQLIENLNRIRVSGNSRPVFGDVTGDSLPDLLIGASDGTISVYENHGTYDEWWFVSYTTETERRFDDDVGFLSSPCIGDVNGDGVNDIVCGAKDAQELKIYYGPDYIQTGGFTYGLANEGAIEGSLIPALGDFNGDGKCDHAIGFDDGTIQAFITGDDNLAHLDQPYSQGLRVAGFASPCAGDFDSDGIYDIVAGAGDGTLHFFKGAGNGFEEVEAILEGIETGEYPSPAMYDFNQDGETDLVVGNRDGEIRVFLSPDWREVEGGLGLPSLGGFVSPAFGDLTGDGMPELLVGSVDGSLRYFEGRGATWSERYSWEFHPGMRLGEIEEYFDRTHSEATLLRGMIDDETLNDYLDVLEQCGDEYFDEAVFAFANTQTETLRVMSRLGNADLLFENARSIYDFASRVAYANIKEKGDYTTIEYVSEDGTLCEMPRDIYYWWVVHPVIEYEIPARVNASYWRHDAEYYGITDEEWTRKEITVEEFEHTSNAHFWRTFLPEDTRYGKNLLDVVQPARNIKEAAYLVADWITFSSSKPERWNEYGKASNDYQPLVIYEKNYGSCGEQAIMCAAFSRTALIPNAPVGCHGEDHAWNELWMDSQWYQWDVGHSVSGLGHPWNEGVGHTRTPLLSITRRRGDGLTENSTTRPVNPPGSEYNRGNAPGYTEVGRVTIRVVDEVNEPVEGALVVVRSKWNYYYRTSIWDYTDPEGYCVFELGYPITGSCVVDVISPLGVTGSEYFVVRENEDFEYTYGLPGCFERHEMGLVRKQPGNPQMDSVAVSASVIDEEQRPRNFSTGRRADISRTDLYEKTGYWGTRWYSEPNDRTYGVYFAVLSEGEYETFLHSAQLPAADWTKSGEYRKPFDPRAGDVILFYNPNRYTHVRFKAALTAKVSPEAPSIELTSAPVSGRTGESIAFQGRASDNLHLAALEVSFNGGIDYTDITDAYNRNTGEFVYTWDTGSGGPACPGEYTVVFRAEDGAGAVAETAPIAFTLETATEFSDQVVYQDNPNTPLPVSSWMLGPFTVGQNERFLGIECSSADDELDVDVFLFHDKNGNRLLDGMNEQVASSTSPTAIESILFNSPTPGAYWLYCQGWRVPDREEIDLWEDIRALAAGELLTLEPSDAGKRVAYSLIDISLSFRFAPAFIVDLHPTTELLVTNPCITGRFAEGFNVDEEAFEVLFAGENVSEQVEIDGDGFTISLNEAALEVGVEYPLVIRANTATGLYDSVEMTLTAAEPETAQTTHAISEDGESVTVSVELLEESATLETAHARIDEFGWVELELEQDARSASGEMSLHDIESGEHTITVEYLITGADLQSREVSFEFDRETEQDLMRMIPGDGADIYDHRSVLIAYFSPEIKDDVETVKMLLDGEDVTDSALIYSDGVFYLPVETYAKGEHTYEISVTLSDGRVIESKSTFIVLSMEEKEPSE